MKYEHLKQGLGVLINECTYENFCKGYDPIENIIIEAEYKSEYTLIEEKEDEEYWELLFKKEGSNDEEGYYLHKEMIYLDNLRNSREKMAPGFYQKYFLPFFNKTLKEVYDKDQTEDLKFYKPTFEEWTFMILAVMTEYYFREIYPSVNNKTKTFILDINRADLNSYIYNSYNPVIW